MKTCWIFAGAPVNECCIPPDDAFIISADRGYLNAERIGVRTDLLLGDFDSLDISEEVSCEVIKAPAEKDDTDTMLAMKTAISRGYTDITIAGGIGGRLDHTAANIQALAYILGQGGRGKLVSESSTAEIVGAGEHIYSKAEDMYFSLFAYGGDAVITTEGTKYNLTGYTLTTDFPLGVSNEILASECVLTVKSGRVLVVFSKK